MIDNIRFIEKKRKEKQKLIFHGKGKINEAK